MPLKGAGGFAECLGDTGHGTAVIHAVEIVWRVGDELCFRVVELIAERRQVMLGSRWEKKTPIGTLPVRWKISKSAAMRWLARRPGALHRGSSNPGKHGKRGSRARTQRERERRCQCQTQRGTSKPRWQKDSSHGLRAVTSDEVNGGLGSLCILVSIKPAALSHPAISSKE